MARKKLETLTEQMYYVLLSLTQERHGYGIMQYVSELTRGRVTIGAGTLYALLSRFEEEGLISLTRTLEGRKYYQLTTEGEQTLQGEYDRLRRQVQDGAALLDRKERS
ncbi:MAG: helix-turn-helix transcriptional regulator [Oscillospiraceae bacterium]|nr:helix-turn-helix transcriptional regulator [Oscillospiraceae bacterium]